MASGLVDPFLPVYAVTRSASVIGCGLAGTSSSAAVTSPMPNTRMPAYSAHSGTCTPSSGLIGLARRSGRVVGSVLDLHERIGDEVRVRRRKRDRDRRLLGVEAVGQRRRDQDLVGQHLGLGCECPAERVARRLDDRALTGSSQVTERSDRLGLVLLVQRDDVDQGRGRLDGDRDVRDAGRPCRCRRRRRAPAPSADPPSPARSTAARMPSYSSVPLLSSSPVDHDLGRGPVGRRLERRRDLAVEGDDADLDVGRDVVEEREGGVLCRLEPAVASHRVAGVHREHRRALDAWRRSRST